MATELALLYLLDVGSADLPVDFRHQYRASWLGVAVLGAVACCNGDTWASQLGGVIAKTDSFLITTWQKVPRVSRSCEPYFLPLNWHLLLPLKLYSVSASRLAFFCF